MKIAISTRDFLHLSGARDFLRNIIRGVKSVPGSQVYLLVDISVALTDQAKSRPDIVQRRIELLKSHLYPSNPTSAHIAGVGAESETKLTHSIREKLANWLGAEILDCVKLLPYPTALVRIDDVCKRCGIDVVIPTTFCLNVPFVSYLYDCQHKYYPEFFKAEEIVARDIYFSSLIDNSKAIIVNSLNVKHDLIRYFGASEDAVFALPFTPQLTLDALPLERDMLIEYSLPDKYFLVSNQFWIHKSLETTLFALRILLDQGLQDVHIVFTGDMNEPRFPRYIASLFELVDTLKLEKYTTFLGYIPKRHQLEILKNAVAVLQPTLFEGGPGGGSIYDSEAFGIRSIVSDIPVNWELPVSDRLTHFEAKNPESMASVMQRFWLTDFVRPSNTELVALADIKLTDFSQCLENAMCQAISPRSRQMKNNNVSNLKISVITVVKNAETFIKKTIESVINQKYEHVEYIIVDGMSTDSTQDIVSAFSASVVYICEPDKGIYDAMNKGIKASTGDIIYILNAGDVLIDESVFVDVIAHIQNPKFSKCDFFYGNGYLYKDDNSNGRFLDYQSFPFYLYASNSQCQQVCFYKRAAFEICGFFDIDFKIYADQEFHARMVVLHNIESVHIPRTIVRYLEGGFSEKMLSTALPKEEKTRIKKRYFGDTPDWFFDRLNSL